MKKSIILGMFLALLTSANAETKETILQILPSTVSGTTGDTGNLDLIIKNSTKVGAIQFKIYMPDGIRPTETKAGKASKSSFVFNDLRTYDEEEEVEAFGTMSVNKAVDEDGKTFTYAGFAGDMNILDENPETGEPLNDGSVPTMQIKYTVYADVAPGVYPVYMKEVSLNSMEQDAPNWYDCVTSYIVVGNPTGDANIPVIGEVPSFVGESIAKGSKNISLDLTEATGGILELSDASGISALPTSATFAKVSYSRPTLAAKYGTICVPFDLASDSKVQYYTISEAAAGQITISKVASVPAGNPAIYENLGGGSISFSGENVALTVDAGTDGAGAELVGTYVKTKVSEANTYYLKDGKFNRINGSFNSGAFKAYAKSGSALAKALEIFVDDADPTAINGASTSASIEGIYNAAGAQNKKLEKGVNILKMSDGSVKKVLVK